MIVFNAPFPENCLTCPIHEMIGCEISAENKNPMIIPDECPFEPAFPISDSEVAGGDIAEMICLMCLNRFVSFRPHGLLMKNMICPGCNRGGYLIETGEYMVENG